MNIFKKIICWLCVVVVGITAVNTLLYYTWGDFKTAVDTNILKKEEVVDTSEKDEEIAFLTSQVEEKESVIVIIQSELLGEKAKVERLEAEALTNAETIQTLQEGIEAKTTEIETLEAEKNSLTAEITELEAEISENENQITALQNSNLELTTQKEELEADLLANNTTIAELNAQIESNNTTIADLQSMNNSLNASRELLYNEIEENEEQIAELQSQVTTLTTERDNALISLAETQSELEIAQEEVNSLESDLALKEVEIASLNEQISIYENAIERDESKLYIEDFLNDGNINVFKEDEHNYLLSSSSSLRKGLYRFNIIDYSIVQVINSGYDYKSFYRASDGTIYCGKFEGSTYGSLTILKTDGTILTNKGSFGNTVVENSNGDIISYYYNQSIGYVYVYDIEEEATKTFNLDYNIQSISLLSDSSFIVFAKSSCHYISLSGSSYKVASGNWFFGAELRNGEVVLAYVNCNKICIVSLGESSCALNEYSVPSGSKQVRLEHCFELKDGDLLLNGSLAGGGIYKFDKSAGTFTLLKEGTYDYDIFVEDENGVTLSSSQYPHWSSLYYSYETGEIDYL